MTAHDPAASTEHSSLNDALGGPIRLATYASVGVAVVLLVLKVSAVARTDSTAMLGSLLDTTLDLIAALGTFWAVRIALKPADRNYRFGRGKAEAIAALVQSGVILVSAALLLYSATKRLFNPSPVQQPEVGIAVSVIAIVLTLALVAFQRSVIKRTGSVAIQADSLHYQGDLLLNLSVIAALGLQALTTIQQVDALFGIGIALYLTSGAVGTARRSTGMLMDREFDRENQKKIVGLVESHTGVLGIHELRTRSSGMVDFIQFHIWVDPHLSIKQAHQISDDVEALVAEAFPRADIIIHTDPAGIAEDGQRDAQHRPI